MVVDTVKDYLENDKIYSAVNAIEVNSKPLGNILIKSDGSLYSIEELEDLKRLVETTLGCYCFANLCQEDIDRINLNTYATLPKNWVGKYREYRNPLTGGFTFIYIIGNREHNICKVGFSDKPYYRLLNIQTSCPYKLEFFKVYKGTQADESIIHKKLKDNDLHINGEWFSDIEKVIEIVFKHFYHG